MLKIRLARRGAKKRPFYSIVVADSRSPRNGRFLEKVGTYNPLLTHDNPHRVTLVDERVKYWLGVGAQPTDKLARFFGEKGFITMPAQQHNPQKAHPKKKAQERLKAAEAVAMAEEAVAPNLTEVEAPQTLDTSQEVSSEPCPETSLEASPETPAEVAGETSTEAAPQEKD